MSKGPKFNKLSNFTTRDSLGINGVASTMQERLCPVVNTVTPRAFYWPFMVWNYYDYLENMKGDRTVEAFDKPFLKKNDYFFVLSNLITQNPDQYNLVGKEKTAADLENNPTGPFPYNDQYFITRYGGMQYYNAGCLTMGFITDRTNEKKFNLPRLTKEVGEPMAKAFETVIKNTDYYRNYRLTNNPVPYEALRELGEIMTLDLHNFAECKELLKKALFEPVKNIQLDNSNLIQSAEYAKFIYQNCSAFTGKGIPDFRLSDLREVLFDYYSPAGTHRYEHDHSLDDIMMRWEVLVGRQYFTMALELIWKHLMLTLEYPMTGDKWLTSAIETSSHQLALDHPLGEYIPSCNFTFAERENMIKKGYSSSKNTRENIDTALRLLLSLYNRFYQREDIPSDLLEMGGEVSLTRLFALIQDYQDKPVDDFLQFIINNWIIKKHQATALNKMIYGRDGYFFEMIEDRYFRRAIPTPEFQGIRLLQLMQVMMDLNMLE